MRVDSISKQSKKNIKPKKKKSSSLLQTLLNFGVQHKGKQYENVRTQLSIAIALLAIQRTDWKDEVERIVHKLAKTETLDILLNILRRFPEELGDNFDIPVSPKMERLAAENLRAHAPLVLKLLHDLFQMASDDKSGSDTDRKVAVKLKV